MSFISDLLTWLGLIKPGGTVTPGVHVLTTWVPLPFTLEGKASKVFPFGYSVKSSSSDLAEFTSHLSKGPTGTLAALQAQNLIRPDPADATKFQVNLTLRIEYPATAASPNTVAGTGQLPVVLLNHGHHDSWETVPPGGPVTSINVHPSLNGYQYLQDALAQHGIISVSVDQNFGCFTNSLIETRADTIIAALGVLSTEASSAASRYQGRIDFTKIGLMGHSRGGDAVVRAANKIRADATLSGQYTICTVCSLAPTDFSGGNVAGSRTFLDVGAVNFYLVVYGALDGDVWGQADARSFTGTGFRHCDRAKPQKAMIFLDNCCHNLFNTVWTADGSDSADPRLASAADHMSLGIDYMGDLFRWQLKGETLGARFDGRTPNRAGQHASIQWSFGQSVRQIDDFESATNDLGGARTVSNPGNVPATIEDFATITIGGNVLEPHTGHQTQVLHVDVTQANPGGTRVLSTDVPNASQDWSGLDTLIFSLSGFFDTSAVASVTAGPLPQVTVTLLDSGGASASVGNTVYGSTLPSRPVFKTMPGGANGTMLRLETLSVLLTAFTGVNLTAIAHLAVDIVIGNNTHVFVDNISVVKRQ